MSSTHIVGQPNTSPGRPGCPARSVDEETQSIQITPVGTRGARVPNRGLLARIFRPAADLMVWMHRRSGGRQLSRMMGFPVVLLTTVGSRSGLHHTVPVGGFPDGDQGWLVVASLAGAARHPAWFINMARHPDQIWLEVGTRRFRVRGQSLQGTERIDALRRITEISRRYGRYQDQTDREIPIVRLTEDRKAAPTSERDNREVELP